MAKSYHFVPDLARHLAPLPKGANLPINIQGHAVYADSRMKVLLLPFRAGQVLAEHTTPHDAIMHVIEGKGQITLGTDRVDVQAGSWMRMEGGLPHSIRAETELLLLLQVLLAPSDVARVAAPSQEDS